MVINSENTVAILIDFQEKIIAPMYEKEALINRAKVLTEGLNVLGIPMIKTQQYTKGLGMTIDEINTSSKLTAEDYVEKSTFSAYEGIKDRLKGVKNVIICGIEAHVCVLQTLLDLRENGYNTILINDCISSRSKQSIDTAIQRAVIAGSLIENTESILFAILGGAGHPSFKAISKLVK